MFDIVKIINFLKRNFSKKDIFLIFLLILIFGLTRIINLELLPIFGDEGIYIRWAKTAWHDASWRFISLTDGRQPLQTWATIPFLKLFPTQPLFAGRLFGVFFGFIGLIGFFSLLFYLWGKKSAYIGSFLYIFSPFLLFYHRMALADSAVNTFYIYILFFSILLIKTLRLDIALILGMIAGLSLLTKSTTQLFIVISILAPIIIFKKINKDYLLNKINFFILFLISLIIALALYNIQRLSPFMHYISQKNLTFVLSFNEWLQNPFLLFFSNLKTIPYYLLYESGFIIFIFSILGFFLLIKKNWQIAVYLSLWFFIPFLAIAFFSKVLYPRYLIYLNSLLIVFTTYFFYLIKNKKIFLILFFVLIANFLIFDYPIIFKPEKIIFPEIDRGQYITGITAGYGVKEIIEYVRKKAKEKPVVILAEGDFGVIGDQLQTFLLPNDKIFIKGYWPLGEKQILENQSLLKNNFVFVVFSHRDKFPQNWPIKLIKKFSKPEKKSATYLFELTK